MCVSRSALRQVTASAKLWCSGRVNTWSKPSNAAEPRSKGSANRTGPDKRHAPGSGIALAPPTTEDRMAIESLQKLVVEQLRDLYDAEKRLTKALPKLAKKASNEELRSALESHLAETEEQVGRLEQCFEIMDEPARGKACAGMQGII